MKEIKQILISSECKPNISPISHEDISYLNNNVSILEDIKRTLGEREHNEDYEQLVYVQGEYKIGEDVPFGTYQIQSEIAWPISELESDKFRRRCRMRGEGYSSTFNSN